MDDLTTKLGCNMKLSELIQEFSDLTCGELAASTRYVYSMYQLAFLKSIGDRDISLVRAIDLRRWGSTWHRVQAVQRLFSFAQIELGVLPINPLSHVKRPKVRPRSRALTRKELAILLHHARRDFRRFLVGMRLTLARPGEIRGITWGNLVALGGSDPNVELLRQGRCFFRVYNPKSVERQLDQSRIRVVPIPPKLGRLLSRAFSLAPRHDQPVFTTQAGLAWTKNALVCRMRRIRAKCDVMRGDRRTRVVAYTLRHTAATMAALSGVRDKMLAELLGHSTTKCTQRYCHFAADHILEAAKKLK